MVSSTLPDHTAACAAAENRSAQALDLLVNPAATLENPAVALSAVFPLIPGWPRDATPTAIERLSGAMTNLVFAAEGPPGSPKVIIRLFGAGSMLFSRRQERGVFLAASRLGVGPACLLEFGNGRVEAFLPGEPLNAALLREPEVAAAIAGALAEFHVTMLRTLPEAQEATIRGNSPTLDDSGTRDTLWDRLRAWADAAAAVAPEAAAAAGVAPSSLLPELDAMQAAVERDWSPPWLVFAHNDLQYGNILRMNGPREGENSGAAVVVKLIDFEYSAVGDAAFDVANHFCEYAADYHGDEAAEGVLDWGRLPTAEQQQAFCSAYVAELLRTHSDSALAVVVRARCGDDVDAAAAELEARAAAFCPLSHLLWGCWGLIQSQTSGVADFDYIGYANQRLKRYHATKGTLLGGSY